jgi:hypothetical protein
MPWRGRDTSPPVIDVDGAAGRTGIAVFVMEIYLPNFRQMFTHGGD